MAVYAQPPLINDFFNIHLPPKLSLLRARPGSRVVVFVVVVVVPVVVVVLVVVLLVLVVFVLVLVVVVVVVVYPKSICSTDPLRGIDCRFAVRPTHLGGGDSRRMANTR